MLNFLENDGPRTLVACDQHRACSDRMCPHNRHGECLNEAPWLPCYPEPEKETEDATEDAH
jgi:hypothetical protein